MKTKILLAITMMMVLFLSACKSFQQVQKQTKTVKDSIFVERQTIDTLVVSRPADTLKLRALIQNITNKAIIKKSKHTTASIRRIGNTIEVECIADELKELIELQREIINHYKEINTEKQDTIIIPQRYIPTLLKPLIWLGGITLLLLIGGIAFKFFKPKLL